MPRESKSAQTIGGNLVTTTANAIGFVNHGATASTARPAGFVMIIWTGSVHPTNSTGIDLVVRTDQAVA